VVQTEASEYKALFSKLGLSYEEDVPQEMKEQLKLDKGAKSMLMDLGKEAELTGEIDIL
jgi:hypothetical protein